MIKNGGKTGEPNRK